MNRLDRTIVSQLNTAVQGFLGRRATLQILLCLACISLCAQQPSSRDTGWKGELHNASGNPVGGATIELKSPKGSVTANTGADGNFSFHQVRRLRYTLYVTVDGHRIESSQPIDLAALQTDVLLTLTTQGTISVSPLATAQEATGGVELSSKSVSQLPLNKRDFSQLLLLAAGTMTDANGATNFTQQFAINGQRGVEATFAMDGADISDPEMGGSTFSNFNVDAVQEIQSQSGWMPAEVGRGASGFTNIITRSGSSGFHGSFFEFVRNSAFDARNYFDHSSIASPGRLPPFRRNEFGFTNGGPVVLPHVYNGSGKTFYFGQYQGFRQVLGTTQVFPVPTAQERAGLDTTAFPGDVLTVPIDPGIARVLARYPLPNLPTGSYGVHTYASSSPVVTDANQFSIRLDHRISDKSQLFARFNLNNLDGPTTNPDQTVLDPAFGIRYIDHQRNFVVTYTRTISPRWLWESSFSATRATPSFPTSDFTDPAVKFNDGSYEPFNQAAGTVISIYGNLFQTRQNFSFTTSRHTVKFGGEVRVNRDSSFFGISPNGEYDFGGGTAYSPVDIASQSGRHNIRAGDPLPDTLSGLLTGSPFVYTVVVSPPYFSGGPHIGAAADSRNAFGFFAQDTWKISPRLVLDYGLRYELYMPLTDRARKTSGLAFSSTPDGVAQQFVVNPQPGYRFNKDGLGPRVQLDWLAGYQIHVRAGGAITTIPPNLYQDNQLTGSTPFCHLPTPHFCSLGAHFLWLSNHLERVAARLHARRSKHICQRNESRCRQYSDGSGTISAGSGSALAGPPNHSADHHLDLPWLRQWVFADLDTGPGASFRKLDRRRDLYRNRCGQAAPAEFPQRLSGSGPQLCSLHAVRLGRKHRRRVWHGECPHQHVSLLLPCLADFAAGDRASWRSRHPGRLYVVQIPR